MASVVPRTKMVVDFHLQWSPSAEHLDEPLLRAVVG